MQIQEWCAVLVLVVAVGCGDDAGGQGAPCQLDGDCDETTVCSDEGVCEPPNACVVDLDCGVNRSCVDGQCQSSACQAMSCPAGLYCSASGSCIVEGTCDVDADCPGQVCSSSASCIAEGTCLSKSDCGGGMVCDGTGMCTPGSDCGAQELTGRALADLLIIMDRSCSMNRLDAAGVLKWDGAANAVRMIASNYGSRINLGLLLFPDLDTSCEMDIAVPYPVGPTSHQPILDLLDAIETMGAAHELYPDGPCRTPIKPAFVNAGDPVLGDPTVISKMNDIPNEPADLRAVNLLFLTDGETTCGGDRGKTETEVLAYTAKGIKTYVVGFGKRKGIGASALNLWAEAGGTALVGAPNGDKFYWAETVADLNAAFADIAQAVASCTTQATFSKAGNPAPTVDDLYVFFNDVDQVDRDGQDGWTAAVVHEDDESITFELVFHGASCARLEITEASAQRVEDVDIVIGCPGAVVD